MKIHVWTVSYTHLARPIHNIQCRIKKKQSIEEKLQRKEKEPTVMNAKDYLQDIAGVRVICYFVAVSYTHLDVYKRQVPYSWQTTDRSKSCDL